MMPVIQLPDHGGHAAVLPSHLLRYELHLPRRLLFARLEESSHHPQPLPVLHLPPQPQLCSGQSAEPARQQLWYLTTPIQPLVFVLERRCVGAWDSPPPFETQLPHRLEPRPRPPKEMAPSTLPHRLLLTQLPRAIRCEHSSALMACLLPPLADGSVSFFLSSHR